MDYDIKEIDRIDQSEKLFSILLSVMAKLRSDQGCVWDREQDHASLKKNLIEETYEAVESIEKNDLPSLKEELGDLLLQVVFHSQIGTENGTFDINGVLKEIIKKLIRRHPHVFSNQKVDNSTQVLENWEAIKKKERKQKNLARDSVFAGIPRILPALHFAQEIQKRAARLGFDWDRPDEVMDKIKEEMDELEQELDREDLQKAGQEIGDLLFSVVNLSRKLDIDCEYSLKGSSRKFIERFDYMEKYALEHNVDFKSLPLKEKDKLWEKAKKAI
ncbi:MAG: nucleoside triphosphate pyrophosphohydrolase [Actinomycetota bacterium]|nr:nucleoside triphosphate pyrophosphohydrolase [Actinomycetota bacterium]